MTATNDGTDFDNIAGPQDTFAEDGWRAIVSGALPLTILGLFFLLWYVRRLCTGETDDEQPRPNKEPEVVKHREEIVAYFEQCGHQMKVTRHDLRRDIRQEDDIEAQQAQSTVLILPIHEEQQAPPENKDDSDKDESDKSDESKTTDVEPRTRTIRDNCVVCLEPYRVKDMVVWSDNNECPHVFHQHCFVDYLMLHKGTDTPCPTCRRPFCSASLFQKEQPTAEPVITNTDDSSVASEYRNGGEH